MNGKILNGVSFTPGREDGLLWLNIGERVTQSLFAAGKDSEIFFDGRRVSFPELLGLLGTTKVRVILHPRLDHYESSNRAEFFTNTEGSVAE